MKDSKEIMNLTMFKIIQRLNQRSVKQRMEENKLISFVQIKKMDEYLKPEQQK